MYNDLLNKKFDYVIFGTSLTESILSAYLAKSRKKNSCFRKFKFLWRRL